MKQPGTLKIENNITTDERKIRALLDEHVDAIRVKDIQGAISSYTENVILFDVVGEMYQSGSKALQARLEEWFSTLKDPIGFWITDLSISTDNDLGFCHSLNHIKAIKKDGEKLDMWWRQTLCCRKINGDWMFTHAHSSVPFDVRNDKTPTVIKSVTEQSRAEHEWGLPGLCKKYLSTYETKDRAALDGLLSDGFKFTSPHDDHFNKETYLEMCWPFNNENPSYTIEKITENDNEAFVLYECETKAGKKFRNTELIRFENNKINAIEVYFGNTLQN